MKLDVSDIADLRPVITAAVQSALEHIEAAQQKLNGRLSYTESEAAALLGIPRHSLRDARLRGEIRGARIGKRILYQREELIRFLEQRTE